MKTLLLSLFFLSVAGISMAGEIVIEGKFGGKNYIVSNPERENDTFCAYSIFVNDQELSPGPNSATFEIDFAALGIKEGDPIFVRIVHHDDCKPTFAIATE